MDFSTSRGGTLSKFRHNVGPLRELAREFIAPFQRDDQSLGPGYRDGSLLIEPTPSHFELIDPERIARHLAAMIEELRSGP